jgi:hypothetical protein
MPTLKEQYVDHKSWSQPPRLQVNNQATSGKASGTSGYKHQQL